MVKKTDNGASGEADTQADLLRANGAQSWVVPYSKGGKRYEMTDALAEEIRLVDEDIAVNGLHPIGNVDDFIERIRKQL